MKLPTQKIDSPKKGKQVKDSPIDSEIDEEVLSSEENEEEEEDQIITSTTPIKTVEPPVAQFMKKPTQREDIEVVRKFLPVPKDEDKSPQKSEGSSAKHDTSMLRTDSDELGEESEEVDGKQFVVNKEES